MADSICAFCLDTICVPISLEQCNHKFCFACFREYLEITLNNITCPLCRGDISDSELGKILVCVDDTIYKSTIAKNNFFERETHFSRQEVHFKSIFNSTEGSAYKPKLNIKPRKRNWH